MIRPLSPSERVLRMNIRNAYLVATQEELENAIEHRLNREEFLAARFLKELKDEIESERKLYPHQYEVIPTKIDFADKICFAVPIGLGKK